MLLAQTVILCAACGANAWSFTGHELIAELASNLLTTRAADRVNDILGGRSLASIAPWADSIKRLPQYRFSSQLHYVNFDGDSPPSACAFDWMPPTTDTDLVADSSRAEVLSSVSNYTHRLAEAERGTWAESESLRFLVHYIEDIHQPLHLSGRERGGNSRQVKFFGSSSNLHRVWDNLVVTKRMREVYATRALFEGIGDGASIARNEMQPLGHVTASHEKSQPHVDLRKRVFSSDDTTVRYADRGRTPRSDGYFVDLSAAYVAHLGQLLSLATANDSLSPAAGAVYRDWLACPSPAAEAIEARHADDHDSASSADVNLRTARLLVDPRFGCPGEWARKMAPLNCDIVWQGIDKPPTTEGMTDLSQPRATTHSVDSAKTEAISSVNGGRGRGRGRGRGPSKGGRSGGRPREPRTPPSRPPSSPGVNPRVPELDEAYWALLEAGDRNEGLWFESTGRRLHLVDSLILRTAVRLAAVLNAVFAEPHFD